MISEIFSSLPDTYKTGVIEVSKSYYFSMGDVKKTVVLSPESCSVSEGKSLEKADCVCKTSEEFFVKIWEEGYRPGLGDFLSGKIKSNKPDDLQLFLQAFGK